MYCLYLAFLQEVFQSIISSWQPGMLMMIIPYFFLLSIKSSLCYLIHSFFVPSRRCGYDQIFPDSSYHPLDGMLGLGRGKSSLISQLNSQGLVRNVVGHCLSAQGGGYIFFGDVYDSSRLTWTPMSATD